MKNIMRIMNSTKKKRRFIMRNETKLLGSEAKLKGGFSMRKSIGKRILAVAMTLVTAASMTAIRRRMPIPLRSRCSILSVPSMWQDGVPTAASAAESVPRAFRFTF